MIRDKEQCGWDVLLLLVALGGGVEVEGLETCTRKVSETLYTWEGIRDVPRLRCSEQKIFILPSILPKIKLIIVLPKPRPASQVRVCTRSSQSDGRVRLGRASRGKLAVGVETAEPAASRLTGS